MDSAPRSSTVLLMEPHADSSGMFAAVLEHAGFRVEQMPFVDDRAAVHATPDVVVIGTVRCERPHVRVFARGREVPAIAITSDPHDVDQGGAFGYAGVLLRPVDLDLFVAEVRRVVANSTRQHEKVIRAGERFMRGSRKK
jgi:DNA-binding response OmpR family regulator